MHNIRSEVIAEYSKYWQAHHTVMRQHFSETEHAELALSIKDRRSFSEWISRQPLYRVVSFIERPLPAHEGWLSSGMPTYKISGSYIKQIAGSLVGDRYRSLYTGIQFRGYPGCYGLVTIKHYKIRSLNRAFTFKDNNTAIWLYMILDDADDTALDQEVFAEIRFSMDCYVASYNEYWKGLSTEVLEVTAK